MLPIKPDEVQRWRVEIEDAELFRNNNFGFLDGDRAEIAGENLEYFERGTAILGNFAQETSGIVGRGEIRRPHITTLNMVYTTAKNIVPTLYFRNPKILAFPKRKVDEASAPVASSLLNYYFDELDLKRTNQQIILDSYLLGMGVCKIGYATQFGMDIPDEGEKKRREKSKLDSLLEQVGVKKPKKEEEKKQNVELEETITAENPYVTWISPFDFFMDPRATSIYNAQWVGQKMVKSLDEVKKNKNFKNTDKLEGSDPEKRLVEDVPETQLDRFKTVDLFEVHYKTSDGMRILIIAKDGDNWRHLYHEKSIYEMDGFQFELLMFNKHGHRLYPVSDVDVIKPMQDRLTNTLDAILDQVDRFVPKIGINETKLTQQGEIALRNGGIGSIVKFNDNPSEAVKEIGFTQLKADLNVLTDKLMDIMALEVGLTRAQLTGLSTAQTATEAQIGQGGANVRLAARADDVSDFSNRQARKLWQVIRQFVDLDRIELITGEGAVDENGVSRFPWLQENLRPDSKQLAEAELRFDIEIGSTQKPDTSVVRKEWENFINIMSNTDVVALLQQQGTKLNIAELIRRYLSLFPEMIKDIGKILQPIQPATQGQLTPDQVQAQLANQGGGGVNQSGVRENLRRQSPATPTLRQEQIGGRSGSV